MRNLELEPATIHPEIILRSAANIYQGYKLAREKAGRPLVDTTITTGFVALASSFLGEVPRRQTISHLYLLEDVLERQNCFGDEINGTSDEINVFWQRPHFAEEYAGIVTSIYTDLVRIYGQDTGAEKTAAICQSLEGWFSVNTFVEAALAGKLKTDTLSQAEKQILSALERPEDSDKAKAYRELVDDKWLEVLLITVTDGDPDKAKRIKRPIFMATLLLQLSEDYANVRRDKRVGKFTLMNKTGRYTRSRRINELIELNRLSDPYIRDFGLAGASSFLAKALLTGKSLVSRARAHTRGDNHWRKREFFDFCNEFEEGVENLLYQ